MKKVLIKKTLTYVLVLIGIGNSLTAFAYPTFSQIIDAAGNNANAVYLGQVTCDPSSQYLYAEIQDQSAPVPGIWLSLHIYKGSQMNTVTDAISGDQSPSQIIRVEGGPGDYYISVTKTGAGVRSYTVTYQCVTSVITFSNTSINPLQQQ